MSLPVWASVQLRLRYFLTWWLKSTGLMVNCLLHWWQVSLERSLAPPSAGFCSTSAGALACAWPGREGKDRAVQDGTSGGTEVWLGWWPWWGVEDKSWGTGGSEWAGDPCLSTEWSLWGEIPFTRSGFEFCPDFCSNTKENWQEYQKQEKRDIATLWIEHQKGLPCMSEHIHRSRNSEWCRRPWPGGTAEQLKPYSGSRETQHLREIKTR